MSGFKPRQIKKKAHDFAVQLPGDVPDIGFVLLKMRLPVISLVFPY